MLSVFIQKIKDSSSCLEASALCELQTSKLTVTLCEGIKEGF